MKEIVEQLTKDEGVVLKPYKDTVGKLTIGIGRNLDDVGISLEEAQMLLMNDIDKVVKQLDDRLPWWKSLSEARQGVLINMAFNLGINGLLGFKTTLSLIKDGKYVEASKQMLRSKWATQVKGRATRLSKQMATDVWQIQK